MPSDSRKRPRRLFATFVRTVNAPGRYGAVPGDACSGCRPSRSRARPSSPSTPGTGRAAGTSASGAPACATTRCRSSAAGASTPSPSVHTLPPMTRSTSPNDEFARLVAHQSLLANVRPPALEFAEEFERQRRLFAEIQQPAALANLAQSERWADISATIRALRRATQPSVATTAKLIRAAQQLASSDIFRDLRRVALAADRVLLPTPDSLQSIVSQAAAAIRPVQIHADAIARQHRTLIDNLAALRVPWMLKTTHRFP